MAEATEEDTLPETEEEEGYAKAKSVMDKQRARGSKEKSAMEKRKEEEERQGAKEKTVSDKGKEEEAPPLQASAVSSL